jgi:hypothetical protein
MGLATTEQQVLLVAQAAVAEEVRIQALGLDLMNRAATMSVVKVLLAVLLFQSTAWEVAVAVQDQGLEPNCLRTLLVVARVVMASLMQSREPLRNMAVADQAV